MIMLTEIMMIMIMNTMMTRVAQIKLNEMEINGYFWGEQAGHGNFLWKFKCILQVWWKQKTPNIMSYSDFSLPPQALQAAG